MIPLTYNSIVPVGTKLRYIGSAGLLSPDRDYEVVRQEQPKREDDPRWIYLKEDMSTGFNPRVFALVEELQPSEIWTL